MIPLDLRQLECFIAVAEERHVGRAAARLHMTQPPLTRRITRIEHDIGAQLFHRVPTGVELTDAGRVLLERAYRIVQLADQAIERTRLADSGQAGALVVGYFGTAIFDLLPRLLRGFLGVRPDVTLTLERAPKNIQAEAIRDGRMHIGFSRRHPHEPELSVRTIFSEELYVALPDDHELATSARIALNQLVGRPLVLFPAAPRPGFADEVAQLFARAGVIPRIAVEAEDVVSALAYVATTRTVALVPKSARRIAMPGVAFASLAQSPAEALSCLFHATNRSSLVTALLAYIDEFDPA